MDHEGQMDVALWDEGKGQAPLRCFTLGEKGCEVFHGALVYTRC